MDKIEIPDYARHMYENTKVRCGHCGHVEPALSLNIQDMYMDSMDNRIVVHQCKGCGKTDTECLEITHDPNRPFGSGINYLTRRYAGGVDREGTR